MYSTKDAELPNINKLLENIDEYDIYAHYMGSFKVGHLYNSPIRKDRNPSFAVFKGRRGNLMFKDHGTGDCGNALNFIKLMTGYNDNTRLIKELLKIKSTIDSFTLFTSYLLTAILLDSSPISIIMSGFSIKNLIFFANDSTSLTGTRKPFF